MGFRPEAHKKTLQCAEKRTAAGPNAHHILFIPFPRANPNLRPYRAPPLCQKSGEPTTQKKKKTISPPVSPLDL